MKNVALKLLSPEEYLFGERQAKEKSEFYNGELFAMAGAKEAHNLIVTNLLREISTFLKNKPCKVYPSDMKVYAHKGNFFTYPDITIVCGKAEFYDTNQDVLVNPEVIIEVLSSTTEKYDRGKKFELYRNNPHVKEYILVSTKEKKIESFFKRETDWSFRESLETQTQFPIRSLEIELIIDEIYAKVELEEEYLR
jgi:Uma2 family endonuclease